MLSESFGKRDKTKKETGVATKCVLILKVWWEFKQVCIKLRPSCAVLIHSLSGPGKGTPPL